MYSWQSAISSANKRHIQVIPTKVTFQVQTENDQIVHLIFGTNVHGRCLDVPAYNETLGLCAVFVEFHSFLLARFADKSQVFTTRCRKSHLSKRLAEVSTVIHFAVRVLRRVEQLVLTCRCEVF